MPGADVNEFGVGFGWARVLSRVEESNDECMMNEVIECAWSRVGGKEEKKSFFPQASLLY